MRLREWLNRGYKCPSNAYVVEPGFNELYVRDSGRYIDGRRVECVDIARVEVDKKGQGTLTRLIEDLHTTHNIYVENVLNERLARYLLRAGFAVVDTEPLSFYLPKEAEFHPNKVHQ